MDIGTLIGLFGGVFFVLFGIIESGSSVMDFWDTPSVVIVIGGAFAATILEYPLHKLKKVLAITKSAFFNKSLSPISIIKELIELANVARREGLLALEEAGQQTEDEFLKKGIMLIVDGTDPELVRNILETELVFLEERHAEGRGLYETLAKYGPAFGMVGTLIGLINMLGDLDDPSTLGPSMAVALITTLYGSLIANAFAGPMAGKLKYKSAEEVLVKEVVVEGLLSIQAGENPRIIEEKLKTFLPPELRDKFDDTSTTSEGAEA